VTWLLDTNVLSATLRSIPSVVDQLHATPPSAIVISPISVAELRFGAARRRSPALDSACLLAEMRVEPLTADMATLAGQLMADRADQGRPLHLADALIAAQIIIGQHVLVSHDRGRRPALRGLAGGVTSPDCASRGTLWVLAMTSHVRAAKLPRFFQTLQQQIQGMR